MGRSCSDHTQDHRALALLQCLKVAANIHEDPKLSTVTFAKTIQCLKDGVNHTQSQKDLALRFLQCIKVISIKQ